MRRAPAWALLVLAVAAGRAAPAAELRALYPGRDAATGGDPVMRSLEAHGFVVSGDRETKLDPMSLTGIDVVLLGAPSAALLEASGEAGHRSLAAAVRGGAGLVVLGGALAGLKGSDELWRLLGAAREDPREPPGKAPELLVAVQDQSHAITQCVTHLSLERARVAAAGKKGVTALATAPARLDDRAAVIWTRAEGAGVVIVIGLETGDGPPPVQALVSALAVRAAQHAARQPITVRLPDDLPLAVLRREPAAWDAAPEPGFFRGRQIAHVMGHEGADWLMRADREETEQPEKVLDALAIPAGSTVADVGAGNGYFSLRLARRVGAKGKVLASDLQPEMIALLKERMQAEGASNIEPILATEDDPRLPAGSVDLALMVDVYHELSKPTVVMRALRSSLREAAPERKAGRLVLVEYRGEDPTVPIKPLHRTTVKQVRAEIEPMGFRFVELKGFLPHQHILIFERR